MRASLALTAALLAAIFALSACSSDEPAAAQTPTLAPGALCPRTHGHLVNDAFAPALGSGPVYPVGLGTDGVLDFGPPEWYDSDDWGGEKVLWVIDPTYQGPAVIRGRRLDGPEIVRFNRGNVPAAELRLAAGTAENYAGGWRNFPSYTRVKSPGCYAYQVEGRGFSYSIVFLARRQSL